MDDESVSAPAKSIWTRKRDLLYLVFFAIHIPVMFRTLPSFHRRLLSVISFNNSLDSLYPQQPTLLYQIPPLKP